jgi:hypothetical protein
MPNGSYSWLLLTDGIAQLAARLADPSMVFWTSAELELYIFRALQQYNCYTAAWKADFTYNPTELWNSLGSLAGSPRLRSATDADSYTLLQYYLLEPPVGAATWAGTTQFSLSDLQNALQSRRNEMLQIGALNDVLLQNIPLTPGTRRTYLPDTILDVPRVRYLASQAFPTATGNIGDSFITVSVSTGIAAGQLVMGTGIASWATVVSVSGTTVNLSLPNTGAVSGVINFYSPTTLYRDDTVALEWYESPLYQLTPGTPNTFQLSSEPPLSFDVDIAPNDAGVYEAVTLQSGTTFAPPAATLLGIPNDWAWIVEFGALADLLGREPEAVDSGRAQYCLKRYMDGLKLIVNTPWIMLGSVDGLACSIDSLEETDRYSVGWDQNPTSFGPVIVTASTDFLAAPVGHSVGITCLANAPLLDSATGTFLQVSRDSWEMILNEAQFLASIKQSGSDFEAAMQLEKEFILFAAAENSRLKSTGAFSDVILQRGSSQERAQNRYNNARGGGQNG